MSPTPRTPAAGAVRARLSLGLVLLLAGVAPLPLAGQEPGSARGDVSGTVRGRLRGEAAPLAHALVEATAPGVRRAALADSLGFYRLEGLPAGPVRLRVTHAGAESSTLDVLVPAGGSVIVDVELEARPIRLPPIDVRGDRTLPDPDRRTVEGAGLEDVAVDIAALSTGSGMGEAGLADAVRALAGGEPPDASDVLFMRGSTTDLKLVLLDGAPVFTPFHVAGLLESFEPAVLGRADLHVGGAPARYDGGLTYILDLHTRSPERERARVRGSADLLSASLSLDAPLGDRAGVVASTRSLHGLGAGPLGSSPYGYRDALLSFEVEPAAGQRLKATGFWNRESVELDIPAAAGRGAPGEARWSNRAASGRWAGRAGDVVVEATVAAGAYEASLPLQPAGTSAVPDPPAVLASATHRRARAGLELSRARRDQVVRAGFGVERTEGRYEAASLRGEGGGLRTGATARGIGGYLDVTRNLAPELALRAGLRADHFTGLGGGLRLAPRAAVLWSVAPEALLTVAVGRYHQHARTIESDVEVERALNAVVEDAVTGAALLPLATADHVVVSLDQELGEATTLGLQGFWKGYRGLRPDLDETVRSSGVDLRVQRRRERATIWLGYGLSWFWSGTDLSGSTADFSGRHLLTAGVAGSLGERWGGRATVAYGAGLPYSSLPFARGDAVSAPDGLEATDREPRTPNPLTEGLEETFLRLDLEVHALFRPRWGGHEWELRPYLRILNALDRRDALFYAFQPWRDEGPTPLAERPVVPVLGIAWRF